MEPKRKLKVSRVVLSVLALVVITILVTSSSLYAKATLNPTELSHFFVPFPVGRVVRPMTVKNPAGDGIFVRPITIYVDQRGFLKKWLNPGVEGLSTHWLDNVDTKPHRIGMKFTNLELEVEWDVHAALPWNEETHEFEASVSPGQRIPDVGVDWLFFFPPEVRAKDVWYDGSLVIFDADTQETLTTIPVRFVRGTAPPSATGKPSTTGNSTETTTTGYPVGTRPAGSSTATSWKGTAA